MHRIQLYANWWLTVSAAYSSNLLAHLIYTGFQLPSLQSISSLIFTSNFSSSTQKISTINSCRRFTISDRILWNLLPTSFLDSCNFLDISLWLCLVSDICSSKSSYTPLLKLLNLLFTTWILCCVSYLRGVMSFEQLVVFNSNFSTNFSFRMSKLSRISFLFFLSSPIISKIYWTSLFSWFCPISPCCSPSLTLVKLLPLSHSSLNFHSQH